MTRFIMVLDGRKVGSLVGSAGVELRPPGDLPSWVD